MMNIDMPELDQKIYDYIGSTSEKHYLGRTLREIKDKFVRHTRGPYEEDIYASLSRLAQAKRIRKSGSHRYKGYVLIEQPSRDRVVGQESERE